MGAYDKLSAQDKAAVDLILYAGLKQTLGSLQGADDLEVSALAFAVIHRDTPSQTTDHPEATLIAERWLKINRETLAEQPMLIANTQGRVEELNRIGAKPGQPPITDQITAQLNAIIALDGSQYQLQPGDVPDLKAIKPSGVSR